MKLEVDYALLHNNNDTPPFVNEHARVTEKWVGLILSCFFCGGGTSLFDSGSEKTLLAKSTGVELAA